MIRPIYFMGVFAPVSFVNIKRAPGRLVNRNTTLAEF